MNRRLLGVVAILGALATVPLAGTRSTFVPDWTFKGSTLAGWQVLGAADWKASDGELVGTPKSADGGWLVLDKSFQDVEFGADFKCVGACKTGVLLRAEKTPTGMKGSLPLARRRRHRQLCGHARCERQDSHARSTASRRRADARRAISGRRCGRCRCTWRRRRSRCWRSCAVPAPGRGAPPPAQRYPI